MIHSYISAYKAKMAEKHLSNNWLIALVFFLLMCVPILANAENTALIGIEDVQQTWLDDGTHIVFSRGDNELRFFDSQGLETAFFRPDEPLTRIWSVYSDGNRIHLLAAAETSRSVITLENGLFSVMKLPEDRINGLVFTASGGSYYRTKEDQIGFFDYRDGKEKTYDDIEIGGLYALVSEYGMDVLYVREKQTQENIIVVIHNDRILWQYRLLNTKIGRMSLPGAMKLTAPGTLLAAVGDLTDGNRNYLFCLSEGKLRWMTPVFNGESFCMVDKIIISEDNNIHLIGTNGVSICHAAYSMNGELVHKSMIEKKCPFSLFTYENGKVYGLDETGERRIVVINSL